MCIYLIIQWNNLIYHDFYSSHYKTLNISFTLFFFFLTKKQPINGKATVFKQNIHLSFTWNKTENNSREKFDFISFFFLFIVCANEIRCFLFFSWGCKHYPEYELTGCCNHFDCTYTFHLLSIEKLNT